MARGQHTQDRIRTTRRRAGAGYPLHLGEAEGTRARQNSRALRAPPTEPSSHQVGSTAAAGDGGAVTSSARGTWWLRSAGAGAVLSPRARAGEGALYLYKCFASKPAGKRHPRRTRRGNGMCKGSVAGGRTVSTEARGVARAHLQACGSSWEMGLLLSAARGVLEAWALAMPNLTLGMCVRGWSGVVLRPNSVESGTQVSLGVVCQVSGPGPGLDGAV